MKERIITYKDILIKSRYASIAADFKKSIKLIK